MYHPLEKAYALKVLEDKKYSYFLNKRLKEIKSLSEYRVNTLTGNEIYYFSLYCGSMLSLARDLSKKTEKHWQNFLQSSRSAIFHVLMCQIWASVLAFPQQTYQSTASAFIQACLSIFPSFSMLLQLSGKPDLGQGKSSPHLWLVLGLPAQPVLESCLASVLEWYWKCL